MPPMILAHAIRPPRRPGRRARMCFAAAAAIGLAVMAPALASAHPLGNFTINHYAGIRVEPDRLILDVVIDQAEIPTFQEKLRIDTDGDGSVSDQEAEAERGTACSALAPSLAVSAGGRNLPLVPVAAGEPADRAAVDAQRGGLYTLEHDGLRVQCIWKTDEGGNHHNDVHAGARPVTP